MKVFIVFFLCTLVIYSHLFGQYSADELNAIVKAKMEEYHFFGLQACIVRDDQVFWKGNFGYADFDKEKMVNDSTLFSLHSISKTITGTAVMQLWEKGVFELDDDVNMYLPFEVRNPSFPENAITFRMLLSHTSGINDNRSTYPTVDDLITWGADSPISLPSFLENYLLEGGDYYTSSSWIDLAPGSYDNYSSVGITLLAYLVEILADTSFEDYCQQNIFGPLGMTETSWFLANLDENRIAVPYIDVNGEPELYSPFKYWGSATYPANQLRTSAVQLAHYIMAYLQKGQLDDVRILESATVDSMTRVQYPDLSRFGLTWVINEHTIPRVDNRITVCAHLGQSGFGGNTLAGFILDGEKVAAIILSNGGSKTAGTGIVEIGYELLSYGIINTTTAINELTASTPREFILEQNYPNPFNPVTTIEYSVGANHHSPVQVELSIYNLLGQRVATLVDKKQAAGHYQVEWDAAGFNSGVYLYRLRTDKGFVQTRKLILLK